MIEKEVQNVKIRNNKVEGFLSTYSNNVAAATNFFDVSLIFGEMISVQENQMEVDQRVRVTMSPAHAKLLAALLIEQLLQYEKQFGVIEIPPQVKSPAIGIALVDAISKAGIPSAMDEQAAGRKSHDEDES